MRELRVIRRNRNGAIRRPKFQVLGFDANLDLVAIPKLRPVGSKVKEGNVGLYPSLEVLSAHLIDHKGPCQGVYRLGVGSKLIGRNHAEIERIQ